ncbi:ATP-grasp domain-containing protein [Streptomyces sp. 7N604]|uniref:ATP-grasp domain-containing protein n=1 Tax=Streptomyces sp. 7N604 TaxID=3457415 RepID=UPI003FD64738
MHPHVPGLLVLTPQYTATGALLAQVAEDRGMAVEQLPPHRTVPERLRGVRPVHLYGGPLFAAAVAPQLGVSLLEPSPHWLTGLPYRFTGRTVRELPLSSARELRHPFFAKPPVDKTFAADVYPSGTRLPADLPGATPVQVSEIVDFAAEFRLFVLDGDIRTGSRYATYGRLDPAPIASCPEGEDVLDFARDLLASCGHTLPRACVLDVGRITASSGGGEGRWAVVEAKMAWFSHLYASDAERALDVVLEATVPVLPPSAALVDPAGPVGPVNPVG